MKYTKLIFTYRWSTILSNVLHARHGNYNPVNQNLNPRQHVF